jgi:outer membrane lipoprotein SlyB
MMKEERMLRNARLMIVVVAGVGLLAGCTDNQGVNAASGALIGAAAGSAVGNGSGKTAATLVGAAVGAQIGASQPTNRTCTFRNSQGQTYQAPCP